MRNIKLIIEYDGTNFHGWQTQRHLRTVQNTLEQALSRILREKIRVVGSGRTDSGVHALGQVANFKTKSKMAVKDMQRALNAILPQDLVVKGAKAVPLDFHARFGAQSKTYRYTILNRLFRSTRDSRFSLFYPWPLDLKGMRKAAAALKGKNDFKSFQAASKKLHSSIREVKSLRINQKGDFIYFDIEGTGFLYKMCRNIVGTLLEIGRGRFSASAASELLRKKNRCLSGPTAPACGLTLMKVKYH
ncbi:MAG: tRNA pseudouridine(38-40) synthase TruA [Candidatus Omnitrophota bacterium]